MKLLEGKTAIITGASRGIGKAVALEFARQGANIAFTDLRYDEIAQETEKEIAALGVKAKMFASNAADFAATNATVDEIVKEFGRVDILVNNAGITKDTLLMRMSEEQWDAVINVNLKSVFNFTKAVSAIMLRQKTTLHLKPGLSDSRRAWPKNSALVIFVLTLLLRDLSLQI